MTCKSSFNGNIQEIPCISVDNFENTDRGGYFLSHYHSDHICGLYKTALHQNLLKKNAFLYTLDVTAAIIQNSGNADLFERVIGLKLGCTAITIKNPYDDNKDVLLNVTLLPAGHCFGSVMFLFNFDNKNILYTGDFRLSQNTVSTYTHLHTKTGDPITIDALYIDTTFQNVSSFPTRQETIENIVYETEKWLEISDKHCIALHTSANYGYEFVFKELHEKIGMKVYVGGFKWKLYRKFPTISQAVTADDKITRIHVCTNCNENKNHNHCISNNENNIFLYIHFSAMKWRDYEIDETFFKKYGNRIDMCFATHCSRNELMFFKNYFAPKKTVGFPESFKSETPVKKYEDSCVLSPKKRRVCRDLNKKLGCKVDQSVLKDIFG